MLSEYVLRHFKVVWTILEPVHIKPVPLKYIWWSFLQKWFDWLPLSNFLVIWNFHAFDECQEMRRRETGYVCPCGSYMLKKSLLHGCFTRFSDSTNGTKLRNVYRICNFFCTKIRLLKQNKRLWTAA